MGRRLDARPVGMRGEQLARVQAVVYPLRLHKLALGRGGRLALHWTIDDLVRHACVALLKGRRLALPTNLAPTREDDEL